MAYAFNEAGTTRWGVMMIGGDFGGLVPGGGPLGLTYGFQWHNDSDHLAFTSTNVGRPGSVTVFTASALTGAFETWSYGETGMSTIGWPDAEAIAWESFDGREISGFMNRPPAKFTGLRPVVVIIHGGPEGQSRPGFQGRWNYFLDELGIPDDRVERRPQFVAHGRQKLRFRRVRLLRV